MPAHLRHYTCSVTKPVQVSEQAGFCPRAFPVVPASPASRIEVVQGATHLFEEPGALDDVARLAAGWFHDHAGA
jgi:hypothetical protein